MCREQTLTASAWPHGHVWRNTREQEEDHQASHGKRRLARHTLPNGAIPCGQRGVAHALKPSSEYSQSAFDADLAAYQTAKAQYDKDKAAYDTAKAKYDKDLAAYQTAKQKYDAALVKYNQDLVAYQLAVQEYEQAMANAEANKTVDGYASLRFSKLQVYVCHFKYRTGIHLIHKCR